MPDDVQIDHSALSSPPGHISAGNNLPADQRRTVASKLGFLSFPDEILLKIINYVYPQFLPAGRCHWASPDELASYCFRDVRNLEQTCRYLENICSPTRWRHLVMQENQRSSLRTLLKHAALHCNTPVLLKACEAGLDHLSPSILFNHDILAHVAILSDVATSGQKVRFLDALQSHGLPLFVYQGGTYDHDPNRKDTGPSLLASVAFGDPVIVRYLLGSPETISKQMHFFLGFDEWHSKAIRCNADADILGVLTHALHQTSSGMQFERAIGLAAFKGRSTTLKLLLDHVLPTALTDPKLRCQIVMSFLSRVRYWSNTRPIAQVPTIDTFCEWAGRLPPEKRFIRYSMSADKSPRWISDNGLEALRRLGSIFTIDWVYSTMETRGRTTYPWFLAHLGDPDACAQFRDFLAFEAMYDCSAKRASDSSEGGRYGSDDAAGPLRYVADVLFWETLPVHSRCSAHYPFTSSRRRILNLFLDRGDLDINAGRGTRHGTVLHTFCANLLRFDKREESDPPNKSGILFPEVYSFLFFLAQKGCYVQALDDRGRTPRDLLQGYYEEIAELRGAEWLEDRRPGLGVALDLVGKTFISWQSLPPPAPLPSCDDCRVHWALGFP